MSREALLLYPEHANGSIRANRIGAFVRGDKTFDIIRPGFDAQGRKRGSWTQVVHEGVPVYEVKVQTGLANVIAQFDQQWDRTIGADDELLGRALQAVKRERTTRYRDGESGESPAPALSRDGRGQGRRYPT